MTLNESKSKIMVFRNGVVNSLKWRLRNGGVLRLGRNKVRPVSSSLQVHWEDRYEQLQGPSSVLTLCGLLGSTGLANKVHSTLVDNPVSQLFVDYLGGQLERYDYNRVRLVSQLCGSPGRAGMGNNGKLAEETRKKLEKTGIGATAAMGLVKTTVGVYDALTFPIYFLGQKPWRYWKAPNYNYKTHFSSQTPCGDVPELASIREVQSGSSCPFCQVRERGKPRWLVKFPARPITQKINPDDPRSPIVSVRPKMSSVLDGLETADQMFRECVKRYGLAPLLWIQEDSWGTPGASIRWQGLQEAFPMPSGTLEGIMKSVVETYNLQAERRVERLSRALLALGVRPHVYICILAETRLEWMLIAQACFRINVPVATLYATLGEEGIVHGLNETGVKFLITTSDLLPKLKAMLAKVGQQGKNATSGPQRSTKGNNRTGGHSNFQNGCRSTGIHVIYHPTCDRHTSVQNDHQQATERAESKSSPTVTIAYPSHPCTDNDESRFLLCPDDRRKRVWRRPGQRVDPGLTVEHHTGPQQGVMVWGIDSRTPLVVIPGTLTAQRLKRLLTQKINPDDPRSPIVSVRPKMSSVLDGLETADQMFRECVKRYGSRPCYGFRKILGERQEPQSDGKVFKKLLLADEYTWLSFEEAERRVERLSRALLALGVRPHVYICILAETRLEWMLIAQACFRINVPVATLYATLGEEGIVHGLNETGVKFLITTSDLLPKLKDGSGRPRATTEREDIAIVRMAVAAPESTLSTIQLVTGTQVSKMTINRRLRERNLRARRPLQLPTPHTRAPTSPQQGVMVWGAISFDSRTPLVVIPGTLTA
ncbi:ACSL4 [Cordylochernes scorpioides]|uniref:long-chain-fatty-acid--CoA ligase n=1 Tax=Cordylochernes scorpioides TaxID=51811 RepID=A0ABY6KW61_9ARAC|nr:ACSL4 [Cordylochernes scorpioides]